MDTMDEIGKRLKEERERLGMTQAGFAAACGVKKTAQFTYESGARSPDARYLVEAGKINVDVRYVLTGVKAGAEDQARHAAERMFIELCDSLRIPFERVEAAIATARADRYGEKDALEWRSIFRRLADDLLDLSPVLNAATKLLDIDQDTLVDVIEGIEVGLARSEKKPSPLRKAQAIRSLYSIAAEAGRVDPEMVAAAVRQLTYW